MITKLRQKNKYAKDGLQMKNLMFILFLFQDILPYFLTPTKVSKILSDSNITQALNYSVNKQELLQKISDSFKEKISVVNSPILPDYFGYSAPTVTYDFNTDTANKLLDKSGYKDSGNWAKEQKQTIKNRPFNLKVILSVGSKGNEVVELQGCLARLDRQF